MGVNGTTDDFDQQRYSDVSPDDPIFSTFAVAPWQASSYEHPDESPELESLLLQNRKIDTFDRKMLQQECWNKFNENPQVNTAVRGKVGRICGWGFSITSDRNEITEEVKGTWFDYRNQLHMLYQKYLARAIVEGELALVLTLHEDGFVEVDFIDPSTIEGISTQDGILYHPTKPSMPLLFCVRQEIRRNGYTDTIEYQIPSINIARNPSLFDLIASDPEVDKSKLSASRSASSKFKSLGGFNRFVVYWNRGNMGERAVSYLRTVLKWINHYEVLKLYEIDHKKSSGAFLWTFKWDTWKDYRMFFNLSDEEKRKTGMGGKITPGARIFLPPGCEVKAINPQLQSISEQDTDILHMMSSGLDEPEDVLTGQSKGTFASVKASRGPMSDRTSDELAIHDAFFRYEFWGNVFFLKSKVSKFPELFESEEIVEFKNTAPKKGKVKRKPEELLDINHPISEVIDAESRARAWLGVKHGSTNDTLGISNKTIAAKMGVQNYHQERLRAETEKLIYPELIPTVDAESLQESTVSEPSPSKLVKRDRTKGSPKDNGPKTK